MRQSTRLILNTSATYLRMVLSVGLTMLATRVALKLLGYDDFGFQAAAVATVGLAGFFADTLGFVAQRQLAVEVGRGDQSALASAFNITLLLYASLSLLPLGAAAVLSFSPGSVLTVPSGREEAARWVALLFGAQVSLVTLAAPFRLMFTVHQEIAQATVFDIVQVLLLLAAALSLYLVEGDRLVWYVALVVAGYAVMAGLLCIFAQRRYPACRVRPAAAERARLGEFLRLAGWSFVDSFSYRLSTQGVVMALNSACGNVASAGYAVALQLAGYQGTLAAAIGGAVTPAMFAVSGRGDQASLLRLALAYGRYQCWMAMFFLVPIGLAADDVLSLWLKSHPPETTLLVRLALLAAAVPLLTNGYAVAIGAKGTIRGFALMMSALNGLTFGLVAASFWVMDLRSSWVVPAAALAVGLVGAPVRAVVIGRWIGLPVGRWLRETVWPVFAVGATGGAAAAVAIWAIPDASPGWRSAVPPLAAALAFASAALPAAWLLLPSDERAHFSRLGGALLGRVGLSRRAR